MKIIGSIGITIKNWIGRIKNNWKGILESFVVIGAIIAFLQFYIQKKQFEYQISQDNINRSQNPTITYEYGLFLPKSSNDEIIQKSNELITKYYDEVVSAKFTTPFTTYKNINRMILPMTETLSLQPTIISVNIKNTGTKMANRVRVKIESDTPIRAIDIQTGEIHDIVQGGIGDRLLVIQIDRIVQGTQSSILIYPEDLDDLQNKIALVQNIFDYNKNTKTLQVTDYNGHITIYVYDDNGRLTRKTDELGQTTTMEYDDKGNLTLSRDSNGNVTTYKYDDSNRLISITEPNNTNTGIYRYDSAIIRGDDIVLNNAIVEDLSLSSFPQIIYVPGKRPNISISVTYDEGVGVQISK